MNHGNLPLRGPYFLPSWHLRSIIISTPYAISRLRCCQLGKRRARGSHVRAAGYIRACYDDFYDVALSIFRPGDQILMPVSVFDARGRHIVL